MYVDCTSDVVYTCNGATDLARMLPQNWADEFIRDWTPQVVTEVGGGRLAVVLAELAHSPTHSPQSLRISGRQRQLLTCSTNLFGPIPLIYPSQQPSVVAPHGGITFTCT